MRIAIIYDVDGWAGHRRALGIQKYAPHNYCVEPLRHSKENFNYLAERQSDYDAILVLPWYDGTYNLPIEPNGNVWTMIASSGVRHPYPHKKRPTFQEKTASRSQNIAKAHQRLRKFRGVICINPLVANFCLTLNPNTRFLLTGVDHELFKPLKDLIVDTPLAVGWCGKAPQNDRWTSKGYDEILLPLVHRSDDIPVGFKINTRTHENRLTQDEMIEWHRRNHIFLCTSCYEGTPTSALEAMACGSAVLSTDVGIMRRSIADGAGAVIPTYDNNREAQDRIGRFHAVLKEWCSNADSVSEMRQAARKKIVEDLSWEVLSPKWCHLLTYGSHG